MTDSNTRTQGIASYSEKVLDDFLKLTNRVSVICLCFVSLLVIEVGVLLFSLLLFTHSVVLGIALALFFFTVLLFVMFLLYVEEEKIYRIQNIAKQYIEQCASITDSRQDMASQHVQIAHALFLVVERLQTSEDMVLQLPGIKPAWISLFRSILWLLHRKSLFFLKEQFLQLAVLEHIKLVRCRPTSLEIHAALANAYVMLSQLYQNPYKSITEDVVIKVLNWVGILEKSDMELLEKFRRACHRAMEEFSILREYAPQDVWVHTQLAYSYRDLNMPEKEIEEYEILVSLQPDDYELLVKLGFLYFEHGRNAKGLEIYEKLKKLHTAKADILIQSYDKDHENYFRKV